MRASTAAPTYFEPERFAISSRDGAVVDAAFVDGGVSPFNDPALQLLMLGGASGPRLPLADGKDQVLLISVGTGSITDNQTAAGATRGAGGRAGLEGAEIADGRLRAGQPQHAPVADELPHALDH